jgi:hypothetical protein
MILLLFICQTMCIFCVQWCFVMFLNKSISKVMHCPARGCV